MRYSTRASFLTLLGATVAQPALAQPAPPAATLQQELDKSFSKVARSCLGANFNPDRLKEQTIQGRRIRTAIPDDILQWDSIDDHLFRPADFDDDSAFDLEFSKVFEVRTGSLVDVNAPLELFWNKTERPLLARWGDTVVREHNCITFARGTSSLDVNAGFFRAAVEASVDSERATTAFTYAGRMLSPYAWAVRGLPVDGSNVRPPRPRIDFLLRMWNWYRANPQHAAKTLAINSEVTGIAMFSVKELTQKAMLETTADAGLGFGPFSASVDGTAGLQRELQSKIEDFASAVLSRDRTANFPAPALLADLIRDEIRLSAAPENPASIGASSVRYAASIPSVIDSLCVRSAWANASTGTLPTTDLRVEPRPNGACNFSVLLNPPAAPSDNLTLTFAVESAIRNDAVTPTLRFALPQETLSDSRLLISFDLRPLPGVTLQPEDLVNAREHAITFQVIERSGARLSEVHRTASRATIQCGNLAESTLQLVSTATEASGDSKLLRLVTSLEAGLLNSIAPGSTVECVLAATIEASRTGPGPATQTFNLPTARFVIKKDAPPVPAAEVPA